MISASVRRECGGASRLVILLAICAGCIALGAVFLNHRRLVSQRCRRHLRDIYTVLEHYEMEYGSLPSLSFFPDKPFSSADSLRVFVESQGLPGDRALCPSSPGVIKKAGLSYLWNVSLNGKKLNGRQKAVWMLVEINALSDDVPLPHFGGYHVLYTDGRIERSAEPPLEINAIRD
jgi:hypothetical protein